MPATGLPLPYMKTPPEHRFTFVACRLLCPVAKSKTLSEVERVAPGRNGTPSRVWFAAATILAVLSVYRWPLGRRFMLLEVDDAML